VFSRSETGDTTEEAIQRLLREGGYKGATPLQQKIFPLLLQGRDTVIETGDLKGRTAGFIIPLFILLERGGNNASALILTDTPSRAERIDHELKKLSSRKRETPSFATLGCAESARNELSLLTKKPAIIVGTSERIIDHLRRENLTLDSLGYVIIAPEENGTAGFLADLQFIYAKLPRKVISFLFQSSLESGVLAEELLKRPVIIPLGEWHIDGNQQETNRMNENKKPSEETIALAERRLEAIVKGIREEENPDILTAYKRIIQRKTPLTLRLYVGAYLLKQSLEGGAISPSEKNSDTKTLFINVGKSRKVFPKDLSKLFSSTLGIAPKDIGAIKVLDNYSFLEIPTPLAQKAIDLLDGKEFRGKKLTVNFSKKKEESPGK